jgi:glutamate formiminotransferase/formiminotetrahydrofolate cyclodeaminase
MKRVIECVPNFSEGVDEAIIASITGAIKAVAGVKLLNVDPGKGANRTVVTFAGEPEAVIEAAFQAIKTAGELIDMRTQKGTHPRMGATDVCPLIPISNITLDEVAVYASQLAKRVGDELQIPVYLYERSQPNKQRSNLSVIRSGEYEGFFDKIKQPGWQPDYGPLQMDARRGATVIGARDFLIAYNINLNTTSTQIAHAIAQEVRESGKVVTTEKGKEQIPGALKYVKAIGWYIEEYGKAQVSMNLTNIGATPIHLVFDEVCTRAAKHGVEVTGSELIGMIPLKAMLDAGTYFRNKQGLQNGASESELIRSAIKTMGLDELNPFEPQDRIIEYLL